MPGVFLMQKSGPQRGGPGPERVLTLHAMRNVGDDEGLSTNAIDQQLSSPCQGRRYGQPLIKSLSGVISLNL
jgi:hypothetical protein